MDTNITHFLKMKMTLKEIALGVSFLLWFLTSIRFLHLSLNKILEILKISQDLKGLSYREREKNDLFVQRIETDIVLFKQIDSKKIELHQQQIQLLNKLLKHQETQSLKDHYNNNMVEEITTIQKEIHKSIIANTAVIDSLLIYLRGK